MLFDSEGAPSETIRSAQGGFLFPGPQMGTHISYEKVRKHLKALGSKWGYKNAARWATHGWRRGIACDTAMSATALQSTLDSGDWSEMSRSYLVYIASILGEREARAAAEVLAADSGDEEAD